MAYTSRSISKSIIALAVVSVVFLSGCAVSPMDLLPPSARSLIEADMRTNARAHNPSGKLSVEEMLSRVKPAEKPTAAPTESIEITLGAEGVGLAKDDFESFAHLMNSIGDDGQYRTIMSVGSAGGEDSRAVVFKTFSDASKLRAQSARNGHTVKASVNPNIAAGLVQIKIDRVLGKSDA
jgi:hypothetical protein